MAHRIAPRVCGCTLLLALCAPLLAAPLHTVSIRADGRDELRIADGLLSVHHFSWQLPTGLTVDGVAKPLTWAGGTSVPVAVPIAGDYWVRKSAGRDRGWAAQRANGFTLATVDNPNGDDLYAFELHDAPGAATTDWMRVLGGAATPGLMRFAGTPGYVPQAAGTETTFRVEIDGTDELVISNGALVVRHISWQQPTAVTINDVTHALRFTNGLSDPIPLTVPEHFQFVQTGGRTTLYPVQTPVGLMVGADDELLGPDVYTWTLVALPEPSSWMAVAAATCAVCLGRRRRRRRAARRRGGRDG